ncbi:hypothetical protein [Paenibacillus sp. NRS-1760]|uniref:hypothetical protein n=1 Tax=Paenibacillus sp. NRS-1760 TaxID=3233902 RepID=UPI003D2A4F46
MRKYIFCTLLVLVCVICASCSNKENRPLDSTSNDNSQLMMTDYFSLEEMVTDAESIIEVRKTGNNENLAEKYVPGTLTEVEVTHVIKGSSILMNRKLKVMGLEDTIEEQLILFLQPEIQSYGDDVYAMVGARNQYFLSIDPRSKVRYDAKHATGKSKQIMNEAFDRIPLKKAIQKIKLKIEH